MDPRRRALSAATTALARPAPRARGGTVAKRSLPPPLTLLDGTRFDPATLKGKVVVLEFWASWCPFCTRQNPISKPASRSAGVGWKSWPSASTRPRRPPPTT